MPLTKFSPVNTSVTANPTLNGVSSPVVCIKPDLAYIIKSNAGTFAKGPVSP